uniref:Uncharacterized protein n=1 Tax=Dendroctonus ponderosae TaxID=77166 RepID=A0AAR5QD70_DENPD
MLVRDSFCDILQLKNLTKIETAINKLYLRRLRSTYQISYCDKLVKQTTRRSSESQVKGGNAQRAIEVRSKDSFLDDELENELLEYCKKLYGSRSQKIIPPLNSARNVFGYMRPTKLLTPLTIYQNEYGRVGYNILKGAQEMNDR